MAETTAAQDPNAQDPTAMSGIWTVHSSFEDRPMLRGFARTKTDAEKLMADLQQEDADAAATEYWLLELSKGELADFRDAGMLPPNF